MSGRFIASVAKVAIFMPEQVDDLYLYYTQRAGELCRQLSLAAIGSVWILQNAESPAQKIALSEHLPADLKVCLFCVVSSLAVDVLQYIIGTFVWYSIFGATDQAICSYPKRMQFMLAFVLIKLFLMLGGFAFLADYCIHFVL